MLAGAYFLDHDIFVPRPTDFTMTTLAFNIKENSIDSLNEALDKFQQGQTGNIRAFKFAILCTAQFVELLLKQYLISVNPLLVYTKCFGAVQSRAKADKVSLKTANEKLNVDGFAISEKMSQNSIAERTMRPMHNRTSLAVSANS